MANITAEMVQSLRAKTNLPMMEVKKALTEAGGDEDKAVAILKERVKGLQVKMQDRVTSEGRVATLAAPDGSAAVMIEVQCESAPVAKGEDFLFFCDQLCKQLLNGPGAASPEELLKQEAPDRKGTTLQSLSDDLLNKIREKIVVSRLVKVAGPVGSYTHHDGSLGVIVEVTGTGKGDVLRDVAMHIAALNPAVCLPDQLNPEAVAAEREKHADEARKSGKPEAVLDKIVAGKMRVYFANEGVLVEQPFAKDDSKTVEKALADAGFKATKFTRWRLGTA